MADLSFDAAGNLYGVASIGGPQLYSINPATGQATVIGATGLTSTSGGGFAISTAGIAYGTPTSTRFGTYSFTTGAFSNIANPTKPLGGAYAALAFDGSVLYGLDLGPSSGGTMTELVTIDTNTGAVTALGLSVAQLDAIAFQPAPVPERATISSLGALRGLIRRETPASPEIGSNFFTHQANGKQPFVFFSTRNDSSGLTIGKRQRGLSIRTEQFEMSLLFIVENRAMHSERARLRIVDEAGGIVRAHLEQDAHFKFAQRFLAQEPVHIVVAVAGRNDMNSQRRPFGDQVDSTARQDWRPFLAR